MIQPYTRADLIALLRVHDNDSTMPDFDLFAQLALMESSGDPLAHHLNTNGSIDRGLWQINSIHEKLIPAFTEDFKLYCYIPTTNCALALAVYRMQGYEAWTTYKNLRNLP